MLVSTKIREESDPEAYKMLSDGMSGLSTILELFDVVRDADDFPEALSDEFQDFLLELNEKSQELTDAQESQDPTLIADILEYEFIDALERMRELLVRFEKHADS